MFSVKHCNLIRLQRNMKRQIDVISGDITSRSLQTKSLKMLDDIASTSSNSQDQSTLPAFKASFKKYKSRTVPPDMSSILNPQKITEKFKKLTTAYPLSVSETEDDRFIGELGLKPRKEWKAITFMDRPGLIILTDVFTEKASVDWFYRCTNEYPKPPNITNLHSNRTSSEAFSWELHVLPKLRWVTLGYHYDWTNKIYTEKSRTPIPADLTSLASYVARNLNFAGYNPEAVIANYYHKNSTLSGHKDESEWNLDAPLFSFSFGNTAIYLQGGNSLNDEPIPILLQSGDVLVMHNDQRLVYHGVPKIIRDSKFNSESSRKLMVEICGEKSLPEKDKDIMLGLMEFGRINLTVRQMK